MRTPALYPKAMRCHSDKWWRAHGHLSLDTLLQGAKTWLSSELIPKSGSPRVVPQIHHQHCSRPRCYLPGGRPGVREREGLAGQPEVGVGQNSGPPARSDLTTRRHGPPKQSGWATACARGTKAARPSQLTRPALSPQHGAPFLGTLIPAPWAATRSSAT